MIRQNDAILEQWIYRGKRSVGPLEEAVALPDPAKIVTH